MKKVTIFIYVTVFYAPILIGFYMCKTPTPTVITIPTDKVVVTEKIKDTTIYVAGGTYVIKDSMVCPPSKGDTTIYKTITYNVEGKEVRVQIPYYDTLKTMVDSNYIKDLVKGYEARISTLLDAVATKQSAENKKWSFYIIAAIITLILLIIGYVIGKRYKLW